MKRKSDVVRFDSVMKKIAPSDDTTAALQHFAKKGHDLLREKDKLQEELLQIKEDLKALEIPMEFLRDPPRSLSKTLARAPHAPNRGDLTIRLKKILAKRPEYRASAHRKTQTGGLCFCKGTGS